MTCLRANGVVKKIKLPLGGVLGSARFLQAAAYRPKHDLLSEAARGYLYRKDSENYGRIHASAKRQQLNPSNDSREFF